MTQPAPTPPGNAEPTYLVNGQIVVGYGALAGCAVELGLGLEGLLRCAVGQELAAGKRADGSPWVHLVRVD